MKTMVCLMFLASWNNATAFTGGSSGGYECRVDPRGVMVCYPKPRGF